MGMNLKYILLFALVSFKGTASELSAQLNAGREGGNFELKSWNAAGASLWVESHPAYKITTIQKFTTNTNAL